MENNHQKKLIVHSIAPLPILKIDNIWGFLDRERIYRNISLMCPEILFYSMRHISESRSIARIKPGDFIRENDLIEAASVFSVTKPYDYNTGRLIDFAQSIDSSISVDFYREMFQSVFYPTLFKRMRLLFKGDRGSLGELDEKYYNIQRTQFRCHVIRGEYERWQYIQSLLYFGYLLRIHFLTIQILNEIKVDSYLDDSKIDQIKYKIELLYSEKNVEYKSNLPLDEFRLIEEYIPIILNKTNGLDYYKIQCERCGLSFYKDINNKVKYSTYAIGHLYGYVEENYVYEGKLDRLKECFVAERCTIIVFSIMNNVLLENASSIVWASQLVYCEPYIRSYWKHFLETKIVDYSAEETNTSQNTVLNNKRDVRESERGHGNIERNNSNGKELIRGKSLKSDSKVPKSIDNMKIDGDLFEFLSKNV